MKTIRVSGPIIENGQKWIYDWFEEDATCPNDVIKELTEDALPVTVIINSGGGYVDCGNEIYTALKSYAGQVTVVIIMAASAASVIAMGGDIVKITPPGQIMIHNVSMGTTGDYNEMDKCSEILKKTNRSIASAYQLKTGLAEEVLLDLMNQETWLTAQEAKEQGFVDEILFQENETKKFVASCKDMLPENIINKMQELRKGGGAMHNTNREIIKQEDLESKIKEILCKMQGEETKKPVNPMTRFLF